MSQYLKDRELDSVLEAYFESIEETNRVEMMKDGELIEPEDDAKNESVVQEGKIIDALKKGWDKIKKASNEAIEKDKKNLIEEMKRAMKNEGYKYYNIIMYIRYTTVNYTSIPTGSYFVLWGSNEREFTSKERGKFFRTWRKDMKAKKLKTVSSIMIDIKQVPSEIKKYML